MTNSDQLSLAGLSVPTATPDTRDHASSTFLDNMKEPVHRWFKYSAGFSAAWTRQTIADRLTTDRPLHILDPFSGSGTVLIESQRMGAESLGVEVHPFVARVSRAKLLWPTKVATFTDRAEAILDRARRLDRSPEPYTDLITRCYTPDALDRLDRLRCAWLESADGSPESELAWLALASTLRRTSNVGTASWQYILPNQTKKRVVEPFEAFRAQAMTMCADMLAMQSIQPTPPPAQVLEEDSRVCASLPDEWADLIITSPPYANNFDYADATRLEMTFFGDVAGWGDLTKLVRKRLITSCTQQVTGGASRNDALLLSPLLDPIRSEFEAVYAELAEVRLTKGGRKPYHGMILRYFVDMAEVWHALRRAARPGAEVCFVIGDSAPYGVYVPVDEWLGQLACAAGFTDYRFEQTRERNTKWKNRKHTVPLKEGRLWIEG